MPDACLLCMQPRYHLPTLEDVNLGSSSFCTVVSTCQPQRRHTASIRVNTSTTLCCPWRLAVAAPSQR